MLEGLLPSANPWECPHRPSQRLVSYLIPVKLTRLTVTANTTIKCFDTVNDNQTLKVMKCYTFRKEKNTIPHLEEKNFGYLYGDMARCI